MSKRTTGHQSPYELATIAAIGSALIIALPWLMLSFAPDLRSATSLGFIQLLVVNPAVFVVGVTRSWVKYQKHCGITLLIYSVAFLVSVFVVFNQSAFIFLLAYIAVSIIGVSLDITVAKLVRKRRLQKD